MNSINGVLVRIQEILTRIEEIRATDGRVQGYGPSSVPTSPAAPSGPTAPTPPGTARASAKSGATSNVSAAGGVSPSKAKEFQQLLEQTLAAQTNGLGIGSSSSPGSLLSGGVGSLPNLESILGANSGAGGTPGVANNQALQQYQQQLLQALQQLAAQKNRGST